MKTPEEIKKELDECTRLVEWLRTESCNSCIFARRYDGDCTSTESCQSSLAADLIEKLCAELEQVTREMDALKADILRATDKAKEMQSVLDDEVHPNCDYALYLDLCDALGDVVDWKHKELLNDGVNEDGRN